MIYVEWCRVVHVYLNVGSAVSVPRGRERDRGFCRPRIRGIVVHGDECMNRSDVAPSETILLDVTADPLDAGVVLEFVADPAAGATVLFSGTVRDHSPDREGVTHLEYEAYEGVVIDKLGEVVDQARARWPILRVAAVHRTGTLLVGEPAVMVAVSTAHRSDAFPACQYVIDELKRSVPIWKKESWPGGSEWVREDLHHQGLHDEATHGRRPTPDDGER